MAAAERIGAPAQIRLSKLSIFNPPPRSSVMVVIKGYLDDSRRGQTWVAGGYIAAAHRWEKFEADWPLALARHKVPYFHMREMADPNGVFAKWHPPQDHREELASFFSDLAAVISESRIVGICSLVRIADLVRFNAEYGVALEPYPLAAYGCMLMAGSNNPGLPTELIFDHVEQVDSKLAKARSYAESDKYRGGDCDKVTALPLPKGLTFRDIPALQAADYFAWEYRKHHENISAWFELTDKPTNQEEREEDFKEWSLKTFGSKIPKVRKSAAALVEGNEIQPLIWDYTQLCEAHRARDGVWSLNNAA